MDFSSLWSGGCEGAVCFAADFPGPARGDERGSADEQAARNAVKAGGLITR